MLGLGKITKKIFGTPNDRKVKATRPLVEKINALEPEFEKLTDAGLVEKTEELKKRAIGGESLDDLLPEAFANCREGARRALVLPVGGAFHSPLMEPARTELAAAIEATEFNTPMCPVVQNSVATAVTEPAVIKQNLIDQLTAPVKWTQSVQHMIAFGVTNYVECGPGKTLQGLVKKIDRSTTVSGVNFE